LIDSKHARYAYLVTAIGVVLAAAASIPGMLQPQGGPGNQPQFSNVTMGNMTALNHGPPPGMNAFGPTATMAIIGIAILVVGLVWLTMIRLSAKKNSSKSSLPAGTHVLSSSPSPTA